MPGIKDLNHLTQSDLASLYGCSTRTIQRDPLCDRLRHGSGPRSYWVWTEWRKAEREELEGLSRKGEDLTDRQRKERADADVAEMERDKMAAILLEADGVRRIWSEQCATMRARILSIPAKIAVQIEDGMPLAVREAMIRDEICEVLEELSGRTGDEDA